MPLYALLGGRRREIPALPTSPPVHAEPDLVVEQVLEAVESGLRAHAVGMETARSYRHLADRSWARQVMKLSHSRVGIAETR